MAEDSRDSLLCDALLAEDPERFKKLMHEAVPDVPPLHELEAMAERRSKAMQTEIELYEYRDVRDFVHWILKILREEHGYSRVKAKALLKASGILEPFRARDARMGSYILHRSVDDWVDRILERPHKKIYHYDNCL